MYQITLLTLGITWKTAFPMIFHYIFSSPKPPRPVLYPTQPPTQWIPVFLVRDKGAGVLKLTTHLQLVLVKNGWNYTYMPYTCLDGMERDNLTFSFNSHDSLLIAATPQAKCRCSFSLHALQLTVPYYAQSEATQYLWLGWIIFFNNTYCQFPFRYYKNHLLYRNYCFGFLASCDITPPMQVGHGLLYCSEEHAKVPTM